MDHYTYFSKNNVKHLDETKRKSETAPIIFRVFLTHFYEVFISRIQQLWI